MNGAIIKTIMKMIFFFMYYFYYVISGSNNSSSSTFIYIIIIIIIKTNKINITIVIFPYFTSLDTVDFHCIDKKKYIFENCCCDPKKKSQTGLERHIESKM